MMKHKRFFCHECQREWQPYLSGSYANSSPVSISGNQRDDLCPICGSGSIELVEYFPSFIGGDIPRDNQPREILEPLTVEKPDLTIPNTIIENLIAAEQLQINEVIEPGSIYDLSDMD